jgi:hypothetical protein
MKFQNNAPEKKKSLMKNELTGSDAQESVCSFRSVSFISDLERVIS